MFLPRLVWLCHASDHAVLLHECYLRHHLLVVRDVVMILVVAVLLVNFVVDLLYLVIDPRMRVAVS